MFQRRPYPNVRKPITVSATKEIGAKLRPLTAILSQKERNFVSKSRNFTPKWRNFASTRAQFCSREGIIFVPNFKGEVSHQKGAFSFTQMCNFVPKSEFLPKKGLNLTSEGCKCVPKRVKFRLEGHIFAKRGCAISSKNLKSEVSTQMSKNVIPERASFFPTGAQLTLVT